MIFRSGLWKIPARLPIASRIPALRPWARASSSIGKIDKPTYQLTFTCKACDDRSSHLVSKQAYHGGTVLIKCPGCGNRHLIADHLNVFGGGKKTLEDILRDSGQKLTKSTLDLSKIGDLEWEPQEPSK